MPNANKKTVLFGSWIVILLGLSFAVYKMSVPPPSPQDQKPPPSKATPEVIAKQWPEIMKHVAAPAKGPADAPYTLVEFGDFQCPQCGKMRPNVEGALAASNGQANLYFAHRPIPEIHKYALPAAQASEAAAKEGKFWQMYDVLYSHQDDLEPGFYDDYAKEAGLDGAKVLDAVQKNVYLAKVNADEKFCADLGINSTPTVILRDNKTGKIRVATGAVEIKPLLASCPWSPASAGPVAKPAQAAAPCGAGDVMTIPERNASMSAVDTELETLIRARYPIIYVVSWEEKRVEQAIAAICLSRNKKMLQWTVTQGIVQNSNNRDDATRDPLAALDHVMASRDQAVYLFKDLHPFLNDTALVRRLRDLTYALKTSYKTIVMLSPVLRLPPELEKEITVVDYALPTLKDLDELLEGIIQSVKANPQITTEMTAEEREQVLQAALGLTGNEAENVFAKSLVEKHRFDVKVILSEKEQIIRKSAILEYYPASEAFADVGGLDLLKDWMSKRTIAFTEKARDFGLPAPKGILMLGVQGCGKSLSARAIASLWNLPLLRLDVGKIFGGIVGQSEENIRKAIRIAESTAPNVVWIDELEKGFSGTQSSGISDGGTTARVFSTFLTWLADKTAPCFVVATANDVSALPPELLRKGRFDEIFFVDLPGESERAEIFEIHLKKRKREPADFDLNRLAEAAHGYSGAEIEQAVVSALFDAFDLNRELTTDDILKVVRESIPLSQTMKEKIDVLREWSESRARPASSVDNAKILRTTDLLDMDDDVFEFGDILVDNSDGPLAQDFS